MVGLNYEDLTGARWHENCNQQAIPNWYAIAYVTLMSCASEGHSLIKHAAQSLLDIHLLVSNLGITPNHIHSI